MSDKPDYIRQPPPGPMSGSYSSHDLAVLDLQGWDQDWTAAAIAELGDRKAYDLNKYDVVLHKDNGRDHPLDAQDESVDKVVYLRTWIDQAMCAKDFETAEWLWDMYQNALFDFARIAHFRDTGERIWCGMKVTVWPPRTHPDVPAYQQIAGEEPHSFRLVRPWRDNTN